MHSPSEILEIFLIEQYRRSRPLSLPNQGFFVMFERKLHKINAFFYIFERKCSKTIAVSLFLNEKRSETNAFSLFLSENKIKPLLF